MNQPFDILLWNIHPDVNKINIVFTKTQLWSKFSENFALTFENFKTFNENAMFCV